MVKFLIAFVLSLVFGLAGAEAQLVPSLTSEAEETATETGNDPTQALIDILEDEAARTALIDRLRAAAIKDEVSVEEIVQPTFAQTIVSEVTGVVSAANGVVQRAVDEIGRVVRLVGQIDPATFALTPELLTLLLVIAAVSVTSFIGGRIIALVIARQPITALTTIRRRATLIALYAVLRLVSLFGAWAAGYATAMWRNDGAPSTTEAIFLTTVLVFGLCRIVLRILVTPDAEHEPSLSNLHPRAQESVYRNLRWLIGVLTFSFMFLLPLVREWIGFATVRPVRTLLATLLMITAIVTLRRIVRVLDIAHRDRMVMDGSAGAALSRGAQNVWRAIWPPLATLYIVYCWVIAVTQPRHLSDIVLGGTIWSIVAVALALLALWLMRMVAQVRIPMPAAVDRATPDLSARVTSVARMLSGVMGAILAIAALLTALAAWGLYDPDAVLSDPEAQQVIWRLVSAILIAAFVALTWAVIASFVDQKLRGATMIDNSRARTLLSLFRNAFTILVVILGAMVVLSQLGIDIAPLLAGAGVIGLAIGFGAQKLVQDIITGVFIQLENAINEGDVVGVAGITGGVEKLSIRSVRLRTLDGAQHIVPFSSVDTVTNLTRDFSFHLAEIGVAYKESVPEVIAAMQAAFDTLRAGDLGGDILEDLEVHGLTAFGDSSMTVRARIKTRPGKQWGLGRQFSWLLKQEFDARGIEIPFPHRQLLLPEEFLRAMASRTGDDAKVIEGDKAD